MRRIGTMQTFGQQTSYFKVYKKISIHLLIITLKQRQRDNVKMLLEGSELTKEDRESQLYDDFKHFHQNKGKTIHDYYVRCQLVMWEQTKQSWNANPGQARTSEYFKDKILLMQAQENGGRSLDLKSTDDFDAMILTLMRLARTNYVQRQIDHPQSSEQVELYERRARFELTEREQKIDEQLRIVICDRNIKEENLKKELHSVKLQLASTIQHNKLMVAISYKNPLCLHRARQVQPALYSGHVIVTPNHAPAVVRDGEETLELTEISRKKMHEKMKANECVDNKIFLRWRAERLSKSRPPTNQSVDCKTCKKRITPTGINKGERGFEQTKTCYLMEVIPFFKTLQEHFEGIQKALTKKVKEMSDAFDELEAELDQSKSPKLTVKYQNHKESFQNKPSSPLMITPDFNSDFVIGQMKGFTTRKRTTFIQKAKNANISDLMRPSELDRTLDFRTQTFRFSQISEKVKPNVLAPGKYAIDVEPIPPRNRNNREVHLHYLRHLKESELLEYVFGTCPKVFNHQDKKHVHTPRKKQITFKDQIATSSSTTYKHVEPMHTQQSNVPVPPSTGVNSCTDASES
ncbi:hypothetical protein Tco_0317067 [Tanacetum coccineum]